MIKWKSKNVRAQRKKLTRIISFKGFKMKIIKTK